MNEEKLRTATEIAEITGIHVKSLYRMVEEKRIPHYRFGRDVRFALKDFRVEVEGGKNGVH